MSEQGHHTTFLFNATRAVVVTVLALGFGAALGQAQNFPDRSGGNERDPVTNYVCFTPQCDVLRHPTEASCICTKLNPAELQLSALRLNCQTKQGGQWVACPVPQRYGN